MLNEKAATRLINEFMDLEALAKQVQQRSFNARKLLEGIYSPASQGAKPKRVTAEKINAMLLKMETRMLKPKKTAKHA